MATKTLIILVLVVACVYAVHEYKTHDYYAHPKYEFKYGVDDPHTHDLKERAEKRDGHTVEQEYGWHEKDREVKLKKLDEHAQQVKIEIQHHHHH
ncbi:unnamed protein product [Ceutorhynchus assimilis]|uniref:Uncharacterized protein n=1 Tax=Ceutorhynchus assimilis TaxID=467358 RepID=A0A9N9MG87_9CUCU|nr:unnamed protein product [Ceutorhynchus assimilis]